MQAGAGAPGAAALSSRPLWIVHWPAALSTNALQCDAAGYTVGPRLIPVEPMYILFNLAMASSFGRVDLPHLKFPSQYQVDYVRVYQPADALNLGCSPPDYPTQQYLAWCVRMRVLVFN